MLILLSGWPSKIAKPFVLRFESHLGSRFIARESSPNVRKTLKERNPSASACQSTRCLRGRLTPRSDYPPAAFAPVAACLMRAATAADCDTYIAWLPLTSTTTEPARLAIARWASGGIILSSVATRYQLGLTLHAGSLIVPLRAPTPHGTWESARSPQFRRL